MVSIVELMIHFIKVIEAANLFSNEMHYTKRPYSGGNGNRGEIGFPYFSKTLAMTAK